MKKFLIMMLAVTMLLSVSTMAISAAAEPPKSGWFAVEDADDFEEIGTVQIQWDADAGDKLDLSDGDMQDWVEAGYDYITIGPENVVSWVGGASNMVDPGMPDGWNITTYFVADAEYLYIGFYVIDDTFVPGMANAWYAGDAFQIAIDFGGKLGDKLEADPESMENPKNIFYSFSCDDAAGAPIEIGRMESADNRLVGELHGDDVQGTAKMTTTGWSAEFKLPFQMLYDDYDAKAWDEDPTIRVGGTEERPLKIGCALYYINREEINGTIIDRWAAGTTKGALGENGRPEVSFTPFDNGIQLELPVTDDMGMTWNGLEIVPADVEITEPVTEAPTDPDGDPSDETTTEEVTTEEVTTEDKGEDEVPTTTAKPDDDDTKKGCFSTVGVGAAAGLLVAIAAAFAIKKKD